MLSFPTSRHPERSSFHSQLMRGKLLRELPHLGSVLAGSLVLATLSPPAAAQAGQPFSELLAASGSGAGNRLGFAVSGAGDVDDDGFADLAVTARDGATGPGSPGFVQVLSGRSGAALHEWQGLSATETSFGVTLAAAGDVDADGFDDVIVGSPNPSATQPILGSVYVFSGQTGDLLFRLVETEINSRFGFSVAGVGDLDDDGHADIAVGSPRAGNTRGLVSVYSGADGSLLRTFFGVAGEQLGFSIASVGDLDGDATPDVLIGSPDGSDGSCRGCVRVYSGFDGAPLLTIVGTDESARLGADVAAPGDLTGDGVPDIIASAPSASTQRPNDGAVYVFSGADGSIVRTWTDGVGQPQPSGFGLSVDSGGDLDQDGWNDVVVGAPFTRGGGASIARGRLYVYSGQTGDLLFRATGAGDRFEYGTSASFVGDMNGDGFSDVAAGAPRAFAPDGLPDAGRVLALTRIPENGGVLCLGAPNSTGEPSVLMSVSPSGFETAANDLKLEASGLPASSVGFFIVSAEFRVIPGIVESEGVLCIASPDIGRYSSSISVSSPEGDLSFPVDNTMIPSSTLGSLMVEPGDRFNFQFWHRDMGATGSPTSNFSGAVSITFR